VHLGSAHSRARPARPSGPAPWAFWPTTEEIGGEIPFDAGGLPAKSGWPTAIGRRGSGLGVNLVDGDPELRRRAAGGSWSLIAMAMAVGWRGAPVRGSAGCHWLDW
jgi:hypothetical protein